MIDINFISPTGGIVKSVNGKTGRVELTARDIGAATLDDVANLIDGIVAPEVDLTGYATEEYVAQKIAEAELAEGEVDLSAYYTKSETDKAIKTAVDAIEIPEPDLTNYATKSYVSTQIALNEPDLSQYATQTYVTNEIAKAQLGGEDVDLSGYYTKTETDDAIEQAIAAIPEVDLTDYAKKSEIPSTTGLATETYVQEQIKAIPGTDLSNYYTKEQTNTQISNAVPDMNLYATKTYVTNEIAKIDVSETDLSNYYNKQEVDAKIPDTSGFALKSEIPSLEGYAKTSDIPSLDGYAKTSDIPDVSKFITEVPAEYITETELAAAGYQTEAQVLALITANLPASGEEVSY